ncbi:STAS domain-containing protein [Saccharothrix deserti]|uniref:STAS domain-containing protein n=1 Tax=Saccharothrix deserti TaxID=2593674 RepID=UPI00131AE511|nr:STAS domain-containing protein [Saccharothrix deserti]
MDYVATRHPGLSTRCRCEVRQDGVHARIVITGEIDQANADELTGVMADTLRAHRPRRLHLNLDGVTFLGAAGVRALVEGRIAADREGCAVEIERASAIVEKVLAICGFGRMWT